MHDDEFEWDDLKAARNLAKHKVSFDDARAVFDDDFRIEEEDVSQDYDEERWFVVGMSFGLLLHVSFVYRTGRYRLISARIAESYERRRYHEGKRTQ